MAPRTIPRNFHETAHREIVGHTLRVTVLISEKFPEPVGVNVVGVPDLALGFIGSIIFVKGIIISTTPHISTVSYAPDGSCEAETHSY